MSTQNKNPILLRFKKEISLAGMIALLILAGLLLWMFQQVWFNYHNMLVSNQLLDQLLDYQANLTRIYEHRTILLTKNLEETRDLVNKYREEVQQLRQRVQLLDQADDLHDTIARLQAENLRIREQMNSVPPPVIPRTTTRQVRSLKEGRALIQQHREEIHNIKQQIHQLKQDMYLQRVADQKEVDRVEMLLGNKGYLVKDGETFSQRMVSPAKTQVDIQVEIVP